MSGTILGIATLSMGMIQFAQCYAGDEKIYVHVVFEVILDIWMILGNNMSSCYF